MGLCRLRGLCQGWVCLLRQSSEGFLAASWPVAHSCRLRRMYHVLDFLQWSYEEVLVMSKFTQRKQRFNGQPSSGTKL